MERLRTWRQRVPRRPEMPHRLLALTGLLLGTVGSCSLPKINPHL